MGEIKIVSMDRNKSGGWWYALIDYDSWWYAVIDDDRCWYVMIDDGGWWYALVDDDSCRTSCEDYMTWYGMGRIVKNG